MTTFNYSSGNPANLTGGATANMIDISGPFADLKTYLDGDGSPGTLLAPYRTITEATINLVTTTTIGAGTYVPSTDGVASKSASSNGLPIVFVLDPADHAVSGLTTNFRLKASMITNPTAPAANFTLGLYPISSVGGGTSTIQITVGTVVSGSTVARNTPAGSSKFDDETADFTIGSSGTYALGVATSATLAANSATLITVRLEVHNT